MINQSRKFSSFPKSFFCLILFSLLVIFTQSCKLFRPKPAPKQAQCIQGTINREPAYYNNNIKGTYNKEKHRLSIRANDTSLEANTFVINIELGKDTTLSMLKFPRLYSSKTDTFPKRQISYASLHWDNMYEDALYENYTYRHWSDLKITLLSFSKDSLLQGNFSGSIIQIQQKKRVRISDGKFAVYIKSK